MDSNEKNLDNSLESAINMTQDEIEKLLAQQESQNVEGNFGFEDADLASLLADLEAQDDGDIQDISDLLNKADNNEAVDEDILSLMKRQSENGENAYDAMDLFSGEEQTKIGFFERLIKKLKKTEKPDEAEKPKKKEKTEKKEKIEKKKKAKIEKKANLMSEEKNEASVESVEIKSDDLMGEALALLQGEDINALNRTQEEEKPKVAEKEVKKKKNKKVKKTKKKSQEETPTEGEETKKGNQKNKKGKKSTNKKSEDKKEVREKIKEKPTIEDAIESLEEEQAEMPHKKKIIMVFVACIMIMLGFLVVNYYFTGHANKRLAEEAYEEEDYLECYQLLYGQRLNESQVIMFHRSKLILKMDIFWDHYNDFVREQKWLEGLDELVQFVYEYPQVSAYASEWNCLEAVEGTYNQVQTVLINEYGTDVQEVSKIAELESDVDYTKALAEIVDKKEKRDALNQKYPDILPEEEDRVAQD